MALFPESSQGIQVQFGLRHFMTPPPTLQHQPDPQHSLESTHEASQLPQQICPSEVLPQT
jgi:hypothetical protein